MRVLVMLCLLAATARAEVVWGVQLGGGLEGGMITGAPRPDGVAEAGMILELLSGTTGVGVTVDDIGRMTKRFDDSDEIKVDLMIRWGTPDGRLRLGVGGGLRAIEQPGVATIHGYDALRLDVSGRLGRWKQTRLDGYFSWTVGCYSDSYATPGEGDAAPAMHEVGCLDSFSTTYVIGLRTSLTSR